MNLGGCSSHFAEAVWPSLDQGVRDRLDAYAADVLRYNRAQNLVSRKDPQRRVAALIEECVVAGLAVQRRQLGGLWADVGSGGGFPGLVLAGLFPDQPIVLIERRQGRCDFLRREVRRLGLASVRVFEGDAADCEEGPFAVVYAKAVAQPREIEVLCDPLVDERLLVFGRPEDPVGKGWRVEWLEPLPGPDAALRSLVRD